MVINFRTREISRGAYKLTRTPTLILKKRKKQAVDGDINILKETVACIYLYVCLMLISCYYDIVEPWNIYVMPDTIEIK
jgi:hypothetical protein